MRIFNKWDAASPAERFAAKFIPEPNTGCWLWLGGLDRDGYGKINIERSRIQRAHLIATKRGAQRKGRVLAMQS